MTQKQYRNGIYDRRFSMEGSMTEVQYNRRHIVVVDDNPVNLNLAEGMLKNIYKVTKLICGEQLLKLLTRVKPDMILLDIQMPGMNGYETLQKIKENPQWKNIPVIFITGQKDIESEQEGFRLGAQDFIRKPFHTEVVLSRIHSQLELYEYRTDLEHIIQEKTAKIDELQHIITSSWAEMVESRDGTTGSHVRNTSHYYDALLKILAGTGKYEKDFPEEKQKDLVRASIMHDIGKIGISDQVLKKPGPLTKEEFECMKEHTTIGADMIQKMINDTNTFNFLHYAKNMALYHHERWSGTGYPCGIEGEQIPVYVRILSIVDVYDALTSVRPYKKAFSHEDALEIMQEERNEFFCPTIFDLFLENHHIIKDILEHKKE